MAYSSIPVGVLLIVSVTLGSVFKQYKREPLLDGYKCVNEYRAFQKTDVSMVICANDCRKNKNCQSFMYKDHGGFCFACERVFAHINNNDSMTNGPLRTEVDTKYYIDTDFEILYRLINHFYINFEGTLWMRYSGEWGLICPDDWANTADQNADVACKSVGFNSGGQIVGMTGASALDTVYHLFDAWCDGTEQHLAQCPHEEVNGRVCSGDPLYIRCNNY